jgi:hypothetical protein
MSKAVEIYVAGLDETERSRIAAIVAAGASIY